MWVSDLGYRILGTRFRLQSQDRLVSSEMERLWKAWSTEGTSARVRNTFSVVDDAPSKLYRNCALLTRSEREGDIVLRILMEANRQALTSYRGFAAHAAVLASPGRVAAILGESGVGKSTLAASGVISGLAYGSDESLCVDRSTGEVVPYPRPLGLSAHSQELLGLEAEERYRHTTEAPIEVTALDGAVMEPGRRLTDIVLPVRTDGGEPQFEPLGPADAVAALLTNSFNHFHDPRSSYQLTASVAAQTQVWRFIHSDARDAGRALASHLQSGS